jgi:hypothetical protein
MCLIACCGVQHIVCRVFVFLVLCCQFLWIVYFVLSSVFFNVYVPVYIFFKLSKLFKLHKRKCLWCLRWRFKTPLDFNCIMWCYLSVSIKWFVQHELSQWNNYHLWEIKFWGFKNNILFTLYIHVFACVLWCSTHSASCICFSCPMLSVSLNCLFCIDLISHKW